MKRQFIVITICLLLGCKNTPSDSEVLTEDRMAKVMWDMMQVDELATLQLAKDTSKREKKERIQLYQKVFQLHKTSVKQFSKSFAYYTSHPDIMKFLIDTLEARGARERKISYTAKDSTVK